MPRLPSAPLAHDRSAARPGLPIVLVHAGVADRRMWDPILPALATDHEVVRVDLCGFGESADPPEGEWSHVEDVARTLDALGIATAHLVGCSLGAGICAELAASRPDLVATLVLAAPGGALLTERTDELVAFGRAEGAALDAGDVDGAVEANLSTWVDGPRRGPGSVPAGVREAVGEMQRRAFDLQLAWPDEVWEAEQELEPPVTERLGDITAPTLVLCGAHDLDAVQSAARRVVDGVPGARELRWDDVAHLPPMERPDDFAALVLAWVREARPRSG